MVWKPDTEFKPDDPFITVYQFKTWVIGFDFSSEWRETGYTYDDLEGMANQVSDGTYDIFVLDTKTVAELIGDLGLRASTSDDLWKHAESLAYDLKRAGGAQHVLDTIDKLSSFLCYLMTDYELGEINGIIAGDYVREVLSFIDPDHNSSDLADMVCDVVMQDRQLWWDAEVWDVVRQLPDNKLSIEAKSALKELHALQRNNEEERKKKGDDHNRIEPAASSDARHSLIDPENHDSMNQIRTRTFLSFPS